MEASVFHSWAHWDSSKMIMKHTYHKRKVGHTQKIYIKRKAKCCAWAKTHFFRQCLSLIFKYVAECQLVRPHELASLLRPLKHIKGVSVWRLTFGDYIFTLRWFMSYREYLKHLAIIFLLTQKAVDRHILTYVLTYQHILFELCQLGESK